MFRLMWPLNQIICSASHFAHEQSRDFLQARKILFQEFRKVSSRDE